MKVGRVGVLSAGISLLNKTKQNSEHEEPENKRTRKQGSTKNN